MHLETQAVAHSSSYMLYTPNSYNPVHNKYAQGLSGYQRI